MAGKFKIPILIFLAAIFCLLFSRMVLADDLIFYDPEANEDLDAFGKWLIVRSNALIIVIGVEAYVIRYMLKIPLSRCFNISLVINLFSSFIGLVVGFVSSLGMSILPFLVAIGVFLFILLKWKPPSWFWITALATILIGAPATFSKSMSGIEANNESHDLVIQSIMLFLLGFGTTLVTESLALEVYFKDVAISWFLTKLNFWRVILVANIVSYIILIPFLILSPPLRFQFNP